MLILSALGHLIYATDITHPPQSSPVMRKLVSIAPCNHAAPYPGAPKSSATMPTASRSCMRCWWSQHPPVPGIYPAGCTISTHAVTLLAGCNAAVQFCPAAAKRHPPALPHQSPPLPSVTRPSHPEAPEHAGPVSPPCSPSHHAAVRVCCHCEAAEGGHAAAVPRSAQAGRRCGLLLL